MENLDNIVDNIANTKIEKSHLHGLGLFATAPINKGTILCVLDGQYVPATDYFYTVFEWNVISEDVLLIRPCRTKYSFINHSRTPNIAVTKNPLRVVAVQNIALGEELTLDYRNEPLSEAYLAGHGSTYL